ncbi:hypothetical protein E3N88_17025 [Mikania micrantha]|uniref:Reverse transcriptase Ty1/copia-type domain-containing protein n=1 Tax=Mikania micrantha TaxID=192012 RepID=A0A5N6NRW7_9ASTR|nr:hypothetical protein E3N88_17025 [Mikania micrantha]
MEMSFEMGTNSTNSDETSGTTPVLDHTTSTFGQTSSEDSSSSYNSTPTSKSLSTSAAMPRQMRTLEDLYANTKEIKETYACQFALSLVEPVTYKDALTQEAWVTAMKEELESLEAHKTWSLTDLPEGKHAIGLKWVFKIKTDAAGKVNWYKARLVAKGYVQEHGIDYEETFSPVAHFETIRLILSLAAQSGWKVYQLDIKSAFLNGVLQEEVYVTQPPGFEVKGKETQVYRLHKALYGLKQAPRAWYSRIDGFFSDNGYNRSVNEPTMYVKRCQGNQMIVICVYVDDIIYTGTSLELLVDFKSKMVKEFEMTDLGLLQYFLGLEVSQMKTGIFLSQKKYTGELLKKFGMTSCKFAATPMSPGDRLIVDDGGQDIDGYRFRSLVGGLIYVTHSRPDIAFAVSILSRFMHCPSHHHFGAGKRILRYLAGTIGYGLWYGNGYDVELTGYTDSDWAGSSEDMKSVSANVFSIGSGAISWSSKKQPVVALSTTEAEYISAAVGACQAVWLRKMLRELCCEQKDATPIFCDNRSAIFLTKNQAFHSRTKHINIKFHYIRSLTESKEVLLEPCDTNEQIADILTKALGEEKFSYFRAKMGVVVI